ncbi:hypothetical protein K7X08_035895 [Anisodus acutangulus]|uniref:Uncharacterized protein n=1 Tax=Anisodus acutangulus TaxID=402998 RepID=A0A9Q1QUD6_9SOLA|nr:hypothetical protein K7X08_035895 [Anisodus acutangulus]
MANNMKYCCCRRYRKENGGGFCKTGDAMTPYPDLPGDYDSWLSTVIFFQEEDSCINVLALDCDTGYTYYVVNIEWDQNSRHGQFAYTAGDYKVFFVASTCINLLHGTKEEEEEKKKKIEEKKEKGKEIRNIHRKGNWKGKEIRSLQEIIRKEKEKEMKKQQIRILKHLIGLSI